MGVATRVWGEHHLARNEHDIDTLGRVLANPTFTEPPPCKSAAAQVNHSSISVTTEMDVDLIEPPHNRRQACSVIHFAVTRCQSAICSTT